MTPQLVSNILGLLTVIGDILIVGFLLLWLASFVLKPARHWLDKLTVFMKDKALLFSFLVSAIAMSGSLYFSEVAKYTPCLLCWYQRIAMYPLVAVQGVSLFKKRIHIWDHVLVLSIIGIVIAGYHYLLQIGIVPPPSCSELGYASACSDRFTLNFGYITISMMSFTAFGLIIASALLGKRYGKMHEAK